MAVQFRQYKHGSNELKDEICMLWDRVGSLSASLLSTSSCASIANRVRSTQQTSNRITASVNDLTRDPLNPLAITDTLYRTLDTSRATEEDADKT